MDNYFYSNHSDFILNKVDLWNTIKDFRPVLEKIVKEGIENEQEERIARGVCSYILSEIEYQESPELDLSKKASNN